jgi:MHS family proline/betaine transporter-like MFS transporter
MYLRTGERAMADGVMGEGERARGTTRIGRAEWRTIVLSSLGGALEFYDFVIYSTFAQYIGDAFFAPARSPLVGLMLSYSVFALGYVPRLVGGVVFSHFGDKYGRRRVFIFSILIMSSATLALGLLPGYAQWGAWATAAVIALRLIQGFSLGGELPGAITYVVETAPRRAGFSSGFIFFCVNTGVALASAVGFGVVKLLSAEQVALWGWRLGFLVGGMLGLVSFWLRLSLAETEEFKKLRHTTSKRPLVELVRTAPAATGFAIAAMVATAGFNGLLFAMPTFMQRVMHHTYLEGIEAQNVGLLVLSFGMLVTAWLSDRIPKRWILGAGSLLLALFGFPFFDAAAAHTVRLIPLFVGAGLAASLCNGPMAGIVADLFPTRIRFSGVAVSFNLAFSLFSGTAPLIATLLVATTGSPSGPAYFMAGCGLLTFVAMLFIKRHEGRILGEPAAPARAAPAPSFPAQ